VVQLSRSSFLRSVGVTFEGSQPDAIVVRRQTLESWLVSDVSPSILSATRGLLCLKILLIFLEHECMMIAFPAPTAVASM